MTENLSSNNQELFNEIVKRGMSVAATTRESYHDVVNETIEERRKIGEFHDDQDLVGMEEMLRGRFDEYISLIQDDATVQGESVLDKE